MYYLALLFFLGSIYNLYVGGFINAIVGLAVAINLAGVKFSWNVTEGERFLLRTPGPIVITLFVYGGSIMAIEFVKEIEISPEKYVHLKEIRESTPETTKLIKDFMNDGKISLIEYHDIQEHYRKVSKDKTKKALKGE
jgi:hypothetical protein